MNFMSINMEDTIIIAGLAILIVCIIVWKGRKKEKEKDMGETVEFLAQNGNFKDLEKIYLKQFVIWTVILVLCVSVVIYKLLESDPRWLHFLILTVFFVYRAGVMGYCYFKFRKAAREVEYKSMFKNVDWDGDDYDLCDHIGSYLDKKSIYGQHLEKLNDAERIVYPLIKIEPEVNNGGFDQFFFNTSDLFNDEIIASARAVGADKTADLLKRALELKSSDLSEDDLMDALNTECDEPFYKLDESVTSLCARYARNHKDMFFAE